MKIDKIQLRIYYIIKIILSIVWKEIYNLVSGIAWLIIPQKWIINLGSGDIEINSWRVFLAICSLPEFLACMAIFAFPESPRFLLLKGKTDEALEVFKKIYSVNTGKDPNTYPVSNFGNDRWYFLQFFKKIILIFHQFFYIHPYTIWLENILKNTDNLISEIFIKRWYSFQIKDLEEEYSVECSSDDIRDKLRACWQQIKPLFLPPNIFKLIVISLIQLGATIGLELTNISSNVFSTLLILLNTCIEIFTFFNVWRILVTFNNSFLISHNVNVPF